MKLSRPKEDLLRSKSQCQPLRRTDPSLENSSYLIKRPLSLSPFLHCLFCPFMVTKPELVSLPSCVVASVNAIRRSHFFYGQTKCQPIDSADNSDLLAVTVVSRDGGKQRRFLVVGVYQIVLVEPDSTRLGWGVSTFVGK